MNNFSQISLKNINQKSHESLRVWQAMEKGRSSSYLRRRISQFQAFQQAYDQMFW
jgi:hypothetical protein